MMSRITILLYYHLLFIWVLKAQQMYFPGNPRPPPTHDLSSSVCPQDSCINRGNSRDAIFTLDKQRSCHCDDLCKEHGDCCIDAPLYDPQSAINARHMWKCTDLRNYFGIFLKVACPPEWRGDEVRVACETQPVEHDPMSKLPVTSRVTHLTYKNMYCAACNNDIKSLIHWIPHVECGDKPLKFSFGHNDFWNLIQFNSTLNLWGFNLKNGSFISCIVDPQMPQTVEDLVRPCIPFIDDCKPDWMDEEIRHKCHSYTSYKYEGNIAYRNQECGICNSVELPLSCVRLSTRFAIHRFHANIFTMLFDVNQVTGDIVGAVRQCDETEVYDPFIRRCRSVLCAKPDHLFFNGQCLPNFVSTLEDTSPTTTISVFDTDIVVIPIDNDFLSEEEEADISSETITVNTSSSIGYGSDRPNINNNQSDVVVSFDGDNIYSQSDNNTAHELHCQKFVYNQSDFSVLDNGSIYLKIYNKLIAPTEYQRDNNKIYVCIRTILGDEFSNYSHKFSAYLSVVSVVGLGLSILCLILHLTCFFLVPDLQNLSGKNLASLCISLLIGYSMFIVSQFSSISRTACTVVGVIMYFGFLSSFFWMNAMAYDVWRALRQATAELRVTSGQQWRRFTLYSAYCWVGPTLIVAISVVVENIKSVPEYYQPGFGLVLCWFSRRRALLLFFVVPVVTVVLINVVLFSLSAYMILSTTKNAPKLHATKSQRNFRLYLRLALLMGLTWLMGIIAALLDVEYLWYIFVIFNTLQGLFIFFAFTCSKKVMRTLYARLTGRGTIGRKFTLANSNSASRVTNKAGLEPRDSHSSQTSRTSLTQTYSSGSVEHTLY